MAVPHKLNYGGDFLTFHTQNYFTHNFGLRKRKRDITADDALHYGVVIDGKVLHLELWPNHGFISPSAVFEIREPRTPVKDRLLLRNLHSKRLCHYTGRIRGVDGSKVAISTCDGLVKYFHYNNNIVLRRFSINFCIMKNLILKQIARNFLLLKINSVKICALKQNS